MKCAGPKLFIVHIHDPSHTTQTKPHTTLKTHSALKADGKLWKHRAERVVPQAQQAPNSWFGDGCRLSWKD